MTEVEMTSDLKATLVRTNADDEFPIQMAQASLGADGEWSLDPRIDPQRFLKALVDPRHGVPFEHDIWTFFVEVPIFVARQWVKHRHASMNEMSGRYVKLLPKFYVPSHERPVNNIGTKMKPEFEMNWFDLNFARGLITGESRSAWRAYQSMLDEGIAEEVARMVLPVNTYTQFYWSVNSRALMSFLERRIDSPDNRVPTHPQWEIDRAAQGVEDAFKNHMPKTYRAFVECGRVAP